MSINKSEREWSISRDIMEQTKRSNFQKIKKEEKSWESCLFFSEVIFIHRFCSRNTDFVIYCANVV